MNLLPCRSLHQIHYNLTKEFGTVLCKHDKCFVHLKAEAVNKLVIK